MTFADLMARVKKQPVGFACGLLCLLCAGWLYYRSGELELRQQEYDTKSAEAAKIISNVSISKNLPDQVTELQGYTKELDSRLVRAGQLALNQQYFYRLEAETEVKLIDVRQSPVPRTPKSLYTGVPFIVNVQGSYKQVMAFLQRLEKGRHFCRVTGSSVTKIAGMTEQTGANMSLVLNLELLGQP